MLERIQALQVRLTSDTPLRSRALVALREPSRQTVLGMTFMISEKRPARVRRSPVGGPSGWAPRVGAGIVTGAVAGFGNEISSRIASFAKMLSRYCEMIVSQTRRASSLRFLPSSAALGRGARAAH